jgi:hypothetical protein
MGYIVRKLKSTWCVQLECYPEGRRRAKTVKGPDLARLGIRPDMSLEHVKLVLKGLNEREKEMRWDVKRQAISKRMEDETRTRVLYLPEHLLEEFQGELRSLPDSKKLASNWRAAIRLIEHVKVPPHDWKRLKQTLYNYFEEKRFSDAYAKKIIRLLNLYGEFFSVKTQTPFAIVPYPKGHAKGRIRRTYEASRRQDKASDGLTVALLEQLKGSLSREQHNWMYVSLWFGLRPQEMRGLGNPALTYFSIDTEKGVELLNIKQTKLSNLPEDSQWKGIPILYPEQRLAAEMIRKQATATPLPKTIQRYTKGNHKLYAGRKGFGPLMWDKGHDIVEVSSWLGHKSIDRTYSDYMKWQKLKLRRIA